MTDKEIEKAWDGLDIYNHMFKGKEWTKEEEQLFHELNARKMINSCLCYKSKYLNTDYMESDVKHLGLERVKEIYNEQLKDFSKARVYTNVYTDCDGITYNSIKWADE